MHNMLHLVDDIKKFGPPKSHSCFPFESINGKNNCKYKTNNKGTIKSYFHGSNKSPDDCLKMFELMSSFKQNERFLFHVATHLIFSDSLIMD